MQRLIILGVLLLIQYLLIAPRNHKIFQLYGIEIPWLTFVPLAGVIMTPILDFADTGSYSASRYAKAIQFLPLVYATMIALAIYSVSSTDMIALVLCLLVIGVSIGCCLLLRMICGKRLPYILTMYVPAPIYMLVWWIWL